MSGCNFISKLNRLRKSSSDSIDNVDSFDGFKEYMHVVRDAEKELKSDGYLFRLQRNNSNRRACSD